jgi:hypothetical protein
LLPACLQSSPAAANPGLLRQLLILLACPLLDDMEHAGLIALLCTTLVSGPMLMRIYLYW